MASGRKCEYQSVSGEIIIKLVSFESPPPRSLNTCPDAELVEKRALSYFQHRAGRELGGICFPEVWAKSLLPMSTDDIIRHAVVALVTLHEEYATQQQIFSISTSRNALQHYGMAVDRLVNLDFSSPGAIDVALVSCVIFASLELLQGHCQSALTHVLSGKKILKQQQANHQGDRFQAEHRWLIADVFQRMETQMMSIEDALVPLVDRTERSRTPEIPAVFESAQQALAVLETFHNQICHFFSEAARYLTQSQHQPEAFDYLAPELMELEQWFEAWQRAFEPISEGRTTTNEPAILLLKILQGFALTMFPARRDRHGTQMDHDDFFEVFRNMVDWAELYINATSTFMIPQHPRSNLSPTMKLEVGERQDTASPEAPSDTSSPESNLRKLIPKPDPEIVPTFSMSTGVVPSLYVVGAKCRDPKIRRKALHLLQICKRREGIWDSNVVAHVVATVINIEEDIALRHMHLENRPDTITEASQITNFARIGVCGVKFGPERSVALEYRKQDPLSGGGGETVLKQLFPP